MAEFVQLRKEKWMDPLRFLRKLNLFTSSEISNIVSKIESFEYKIQTPNRKLEDVLMYIEFECNLLKAIQQRRKSANQYERTDEIDRFIYGEIFAQFGSSEINFQHNLEYWNARLKFIASVVPHENREVEFNRIFRKALDYCGRANLDLYPKCVNFMWTFLHLDPDNEKPRKKKPKLSREKKNVTRIMGTIREITKEALRNHSRSHQAFIWVIATELHYLTKLPYEQELGTQEVQEEIGRTEALIRILCDNFLDKFQNAVCYFQLYNAMKSFDIPQVSLLTKKVYQQILSIHPRTLEVHSWLIDKTIEDGKYEECKERMNQALSNLPKIKTLSMCLGKLDKLLNVLERSGSKDVSLLKLIAYFAEILDKSNNNWAPISSEDYHISRIKLLRSIPKLQLSEGSCANDDDELRQSIQIITHFVESHPLKQTIIMSARKFPNCFTFAKERILLCLAKGDSVKAGVICKILRELNLNKVFQNKDELVEVQQFLYFLYFTFISSNKLKRHTEKLLNVPGMDTIRIIHLKKLYLESPPKGAEFYERFKNLTNQWELPLTVVQLERRVCICKEISPTLHRAIEDTTRLVGTSSIDPWKICIKCLHDLKEEKAASELLQRALKLFSLNSDHEAMLQDLLLFSKSYKK